MKILSVVGARPNFMKVAPLIAAMECYDNAIEHRLVHTGQHYDRQMNDVFFLISQYRNQISIWLLAPEVMPARRLG